MTTIRQQDFIDSIAAALQFISYYHPPIISTRWRGLSARRIACGEGCDGADPD